MSVPAAKPGFAWWAPFAALLASTVATTMVLIGMLAAGGVDGDSADDLSAGGTLVVSFASQLFLLGAAFAFARVTLSHVTLAAFGWRRPRLSRELLWLVPLLFVVFQVVLIVFAGLVDPGAEDTLATDLGARDSTAALIGVAVFAALVAPVVEEVVFRGFLFPALRGKLGWIPAAILSGFIFGALHGGTDPVFLLPLAVFGVVLCVLYQRTGSLIPGMGLHALNNGLALGSTLDWSAPAIVASAVLAPVIVVGFAWAVSAE